MTKPTYYEFFAGGGMARAGFGAGWRCLLANDVSEKKARAYRENWGDDDFILADIAALDAADLPGAPDVAWASFPCQDLSLAGVGAGLKGARSGVFWSFWALITNLNKAGRAPAIIALENVTGFLSSRGGEDFEMVLRAFNKEGYRCGALVIDAVHFTPQSRPRVFLIALKKTAPLPANLVADNAPPLWRGAALERAYGRLSDDLKENWVWWRLPSPRRNPPPLRDIIEPAPNTVAWDSPEATATLLDMMSPKNAEKVAAIKQRATQETREFVGALYKRTRIVDGVRRQRAEVRFDDTAGCLRTPAGGSSRQRLLFVDADKIRSRLISPRETARLMGLPDSYLLPEKYNEAYHLTGDGVVVPVIAHLRKHIFDPLIAAQNKARSEAA